MAAGQPARSGIDFSAFRNPKLARELIERIHELVGDRAINLMEVCGTHTVSIGRYGFRSIMPAGLKLLSGPGCPVCVTANRDIDHAIALANIDDAIITTFGDMMRVPGSSTSLAAQKASGRDIRIVYSPLDALDIAEQNPDRPVIFMGVGFETTTPTIAAAILEAEARGLLNFSVYCAHKTTPPALRAIANDPETAIDGFILPGHVATITGLAPFSFLVDEFDTPGVVTGFEPVDILQGICMLVQMVVEGRPAIGNAYRRGVNADGNPVARQLVEQVFEPCDTTWRGLGLIANSAFPSAPSSRALMPVPALTCPSRRQSSRVGAAAATCCAGPLRRATAPCGAPVARPNSPAPPPGGARRPAAPNIPAPAHNRSPRPTPGGTSRRCASPI